MQDYVDEEERVESRAELLDVQPAAGSEWKQGEGHAMEMSDVHMVFGLVHKERGGEGWREWVKTGKERVREDLARPSQRKAQPPDANDVHQNSCPTSLPYRLRSRHAISKPVSRRLCPPQDYALRRW